MQGLHFEEFEIGRVFDHTIRRTVTEMDNTLFSCLTHNPQPLHIDREFCAGTEWGQPLMNSLFTLGLMIDIAVNDTTMGTTIANLGMSEVRFPAPLFHGDTVYAIADGRRLPRSVDLVADLGTRILVRGQLDAGEPIVTSRLAEIGPGLRVEVSE